MIEWFKKYKVIIIVCVSIILLLSAFFGGGLYTNRKIDTTGMGSEISSLTGKLQSATNTIAEQGEIISILRSELEQSTTEQQRIIDELRDSESRAVDIIKSGADGIAGVRAEIQQYINAEQKIEKSIMDNNPDSNN